MATATAATSGQRPLPVESLLPFPQQKRDSESLSALQTALQQARKEADESSEPEEEGEHAEQGNDDNGKPTKRPKRARACIACRNMKIRCLPVEGQEACLSCSKVNRECVMPGPPRKRQKTVHKVAELEKKINALTDALIQKGTANPTPPGDSPLNDRTVDSQSDLTRSETNHSEHVSSEATMVDDRTQRTGLNLFPRTGPAPKPMPTMEKGDLDFGCSIFSRRPGGEPYIDIINRELIEMELASQIFEHYKSVMMPYFPMLALSPSQTAQDVRESKPMVFLAILAVAASAIKPELQADLVVELNRQLSERVMFLGEKSIDMVQAMLLYTCYYVRSRYAKDLSFNIYIHAAVVMCLDLGLGKKDPRKLNRAGYDEAEVRRTWMGAYYFASNVSTLMRHPSLVRWSSYMEECIEFFQTSPFAQPSDAWLISMVQIQHIAEEVSIVFNMDDATSTISFADMKTQYHLKTFEKQLAHWRTTVPKNIEPILVEHLASSVNLYIHEIAIHHDHNVDEFRGDVPKFGQDSRALPVVTSVHIDALTTSLDACHSVLSSFLAAPVSLCRSVPNLHIVWNTYASVALIKLHGLIHAPGSTFGSIFTPDLKAEYYLDALTEKLSEISRGGAWPPAEAFIFVTRKLKSWHTHKKAPYLEDSQLAPEAEGLNDLGGFKKDFWARQGKDGRSPEEREQQYRQEDEATDNMLRTLRQHQNLPERYGEAKKTSSGSMSPPPLTNKFYNDAYDSMADRQQQQKSNGSNNAAGLLPPPTTSTTSQPPFSIAGPGVPIKNMAPGPGGPWVPFSPGPSQGGLNDFGASQTSEMNAAYNAANYNINWDELNFSQDELNVFDSYMNDAGWMGYIM